MYSDMASIPRVSAREPPCALRSQFTFGPSTSAIDATGAKKAPVNIKAQARKVDLNMKVSPFK